MAQRSSLLAGLEGDAAQAERVADDADGAHAHRSTRDHRVQQQTESRIEDPGGDRYRERVEHEREEQVLPNVAHRRPTQPPRPHDPLQVAFDQSNAGTLHRRVGAGAHRDADLRLGVVDAVTRHCDETALILQFLHGRSLLIRQHLGHDLVDTELACDGLRRGAAVPGQHHHAVALLPQRLQGAGGAFFEGIGHGDKSCRPPVDGDQHYPLTLLAKLLRASGQTTRIDPKRSKKCPVADGDMFAVDRADDTHPGLRRKVERGAELDFTLLGTSDDGGCKRMLAIPFETGDKPQQLVLANRASRGDTNEPRLAKR